MKPRPKRNKRDRLLILARILAAINGADGAGISNYAILQTVNLNNRVARPYLKLLVKNGHIAKENGLYKITADGRILLPKIKNIGKLLQLTDNFCQLTGKKRVILWIS